jgi:hypothetical protein
MNYQEFAYTVLLEATQLVDRYGIPITDEGRKKKRRAVTAMSTGMGGAMAAAITPSHSKGVKKYITDNYEEKGEKIGRKIGLHTSRDKKAKSSLQRALKREDSVKRALHKLRKGYKRRPSKEEKFTNVAKRVVDRWQKSKEKYKTAGTAKLAKRIKKTGEIGRKVGRVAGKIAGAKTPIVLGGAAIGGASAYGMARGLEKLSDRNPETRIIRKIKGQKV